MKVLLTGAKGFIGTHMAKGLAARGHEVLPFDRLDSLDLLKRQILAADCIIHLAGVNRPSDPKEYYEGNAGFTEKIVDLQGKLGKNLPIIFASSIQATLDNDYGKSKKAAEEILLSSSCRTVVYRLKNVFGPGCRPRYNSVVATFCDNLAHDRPLEISDAEKTVPFQYVDDVVQAFIDSAEHLVEEQGYSEIEPIELSKTYPCSLGELASLLGSFKAAIESKEHLPQIKDGLALALFKTYCSYASDAGLTFNMAVDARGGFEEIFKSKRFGQISINTIRPHATKGGHYHTYKQEVFLVVRGSCLIRQRNQTAIYENKVNGERQTRIPIRTNHLHEITNLGEEEAIVLMWISHIYDPNTHDTYREE